MSRASTVGWLLGFARTSTLLLVASILSRLLGHALGIALLAVPAWVIGHLLTDQTLSAGWLLGIYLAIAAGKALLRYTEQLCGHLAAFKLLGEMRIWMLDKLIPQAPAVTDGTGAARLNQTALKDVDRIEVFFAHTIAPVISAVFIPVTASIFAWTTAGWATGLTVLVVLTLGAVLPLLWYRRAKHITARQLELRADIAQHVSDSMRLKDDITAFGTEPLRIEQLAALDEQLARTLKASGGQAGLRRGVSDARLFLGTAAVLTVGLLTADFTWALVAATFVFGTNNSLEAVERLANSLPQGLAATERIRTLGEQPPAVTEPDEPEPIHHPIAPRLNEVNFTYPGAPKPSLRGITAEFTAPFIGITGATGSGKSTLAALLQRHFDPSDGEFTSGDQHVADLGSSAWQQHVVMVEQNPFFISGTLADNLRLADPEATDVTLQQALSTAGLDVELDRQLGRRAARLSGGQRQRLALARALIRLSDHPENSLLILDEATSHQDPLTQRAIMNTVLELGIRLVIIAHRIETLREADEILVLENGEICERGTYDELAQSDGVFARLLDEQRTDTPR